MKCPNCNTINPDNAQFCRNCGMNLNETDIPEEEIVHVPTVETDDDYQKANTDSLHLQYSVFIKSTIRGQVL